MTGRKQMELKPPKRLRVRTIQTVRFGKSKIDLELARKTLRDIIKEREDKQVAASE